MHPCGIRAGSRCFPPPHFRKGSGMRFSITLRRSLLSHLVLATVVGLFATGLAVGQEAATADADQPDATGEATAETPPAEGQTQVNPQELHDKGQEAMKNGDYQAALQAFDTLARAGEA